MSFTYGRAPRRVRRLGAVCGVGIVTGSRRGRVCISSKNRKLWGEERVGPPGPEAGDFEGIVAGSPTQSATLTPTATRTAIEYVRRSG